MKPALLFAAAIALLPTALAHGGPIKGADVPPGGTWNWAFDEYGTVLYHCHQHPNMWGRVIVSTTGARGANVTMNDFAFEPTTITVRYGVLVNWTNEGQTVHSVWQNTTEHGHTTAAGDSPGLGWALPAGVLFLAAWAARRRR